MVAALPSEVKGQGHEAPKLFSPPRLEIKHPDGCTNCLGRMNGRHEADRSGAPLRDSVVKVKQAGRSRPRERAPPPSILARRPRQAFDLKRACVYTDARTRCFEQGFPMRGGKPRKEATGKSSDAAGCGLRHSRRGAVCHAAFSCLVPPTPRLAQFSAGFTDRPS